MKSILSLLLLVIFFSCKKEGVQISQVNLKGRWELSRRWGTIAGIDESFPPGNGAILQFSGDNFFQYSGTQLLQSGTVSIVEDTTSFTIKGERITFHASSGTTSVKFLVVSDTSLMFSDYFTDGEYKLYRRL